MARIKGATAYDQIAHRLFDARFCRVSTPAACRNCGTILGIEYHEERLYSLKCEKCSIVTLVKAKNPAEAAMAVGEIVPHLMEG